jgi:hypothetical protein
MKYEHPNELADIFRGITTVMKNAVEHAKDLSQKLEEAAERERKLRDIAEELLMWCEEGGPFRHDKAWPEVARRARAALSLPERE